MSNRPKARSEAIMESVQNLLDNIGYCLTVCRDAAGMTQREAAKVTGSTQATISGLENGKKDVHLGTLQNIARGYGYDVEVLFVPIEEEAEEVVEPEKPEPARPMREVRGGFN